MKSASLTGIASFHIPAFLTVLIAALLGATIGCGSSSISSSSMPKLSGNTAVTVLLSSTANDGVSEFDLTIQSLTLTDQAGKTIPVLSASSPAEFVHLNGNIEPLTTVCSGCVHFGDRHSSGSRICLYFARSKRRTSILPLLDRQPGPCRDFDLTHHRYRQQHGPFAEPSGF